MTDRTADPVDSATLATPHAWGLLDYFVSLLTHWEAAKALYWLRVELRKLQDDLAEARSVTACGCGEVEWAEATAPPVTRIPVDERKPPDWTGSAQARERQNIKASKRRDEDARRKELGDAWVTRELERMPKR